VRFLITAGPTREPIDPVRYLSNRSSGKMGYAIAEAALAANHEVLLISGPASLALPEGARRVDVVTSDQMHDAVHQNASGCDVLVMCAAVADYKPARASPQKIKKGAAGLILELVPTRDILSSIGPERNFLVVGFAAETNDLEENARKKLRDKNCDMVVGNDVSRSDRGMESDENEVTIFFRNGEIIRISRSSKKNIAQQLVKIIANTREKRLTKKT
jgi:phosphopantothenoylcysteine decarboxylase/phosphopantothenate--cysteine ligase